MDINGITQYADYMNQINTANTDNLKKNINAAADSKEDDELMSACRQFESYLLEQVFKAMEKTVIKNEDSPLSMAATSNVLVDYFKDMTIRKVAEESTNNQGLGLAQMLYEQMRRNYGASGSSVDPSSIPSDGTV